MAEEGTVIETQGPENFPRFLGVGEHLIIQGEQGGISILELNPEEEKIVQEFEALEHRTWNHSTLARRILLVRNDREAVAFQY